MHRLRVAHASLRRLALLATLGAILAFAIGPAVGPVAASSTTASAMESELASWVNSARATRGLAPLRVLPALQSYADSRAASMASTGSLSHPSCLGCDLSARGIQWYGAAEAIAGTSYPWGGQAAQSIFNGWKASSGHWAILMSTTLNYIGLGVAYRSSNATTYAAADLTESIDQSRPWTRMSSVGRSGTTVTWKWTGNDLWLQSHEAGLKNFDVQYRVDSGSWVTIKSGTTMRYLTLGSRAGGHYYGLRVRARDNRGYVSGYTAELRIWVP